MPGGFQAWCIAARSLKKGGQINSSNKPRAEVVSVTPSSLVTPTSKYDSEVIVRVDGQQYSATVHNDIGQNADFDPV